MVSNVGVYFVCLEVDMRWLTYVIRSMAPSL